MTHFPFQSIPTSPSFREHTPFAGWRRRIRECPASDCRVSSVEYRVSSVEYPKNISSNSPDLPPLHHHLYIHTNIPQHRHRHLLITLYADPIQHSSIYPHKHKHRHLPITLYKHPPLQHSSIYPHQHRHRHLLITLYKDQHRHLYTDPTPTSPIYPHQHRHRHLPITLYKDQHRHHL